MKTAKIDNTLTEVNENTDTLVTVENNKNGKLSKLQTELRSEYKGSQLTEFIYTVSGEQGKKTRFADYAIKMALVKLSTKSLQFTYGMFYDSEQLESFTIQINLGNFKETMSEYVLTAYSQNNTSKKPQLVFNEVSAEQVGLPLETLRHYTHKHFIDRATFTLVNALAISHKDLFVLEYNPFLLLGALIHQNFKTNFQEYTDDNSKPIQLNSLKILDCFQAIVDSYEHWQLPMNKVFMALAAENTLV
jgi:hypothetical protein